jgi:hypothetical protein
VGDGAAFPQSTVRIIGDETRLSAPFSRTNYVIGGVESETNSRVLDGKERGRAERQESEEKGGAGAEAALKSN